MGSRTHKDFTQLDTMYHRDDAAQQRTQEVIDMYDQRHVPSQPHWQQYRDGTGRRAFGEEHRSAGSSRQSAPLTYDIQDDRVHDVFGETMRDPGPRDPRAVAAHHGRAPATHGAMKINETRGSMAPRAEHKRGSGGSVASGNTNYTNNSNFSPMSDGEAWRYHNPTAATATPLNASAYTQPMNERQAAMGPPHPAEPGPAAAQPQAKPKPKSEAEKEAQLQVNDGDLIHEVKNERMFQRMIPEREFSHEETSVETRVVDYIPVIAEQPVDMNQMLRAYRLQRPIKVRPIVISDRYASTIMLPHDHDHRAVYSDASLPFVSPVTTKRVMNWSAPCKVSRRQLQA